MRSYSKISRAFTFIIAFTLAMAICIGSFSVTKYKFKASAAAATVATLTIHSDPTGGHCGLPTGQHAFLSIRNKTKNKINILDTMVEPNGAITIGTSSSIDGKGDGIYTNAEAWLIKYKGRYKNRVSLSMNLTSGQLFTVTNTMLKNNTWTEFKNCAYFARTVWNSVAPQSKQLSGGLPVTLADSIKSKNGYKKAAKIGTCDKANVRRIYSLNSSAKVKMK